MKPSKTNHQQDLIFQNRLSDELNPKHQLYILSKYIDWQDLEKDFATFFIDNIGAPAKPVRLVTGLLMLQHMYNDPATIF